MRKVKLSVVILSYNTLGLLRDCLSSLEKVKKEINFEIIVPDNGSTDGSVEMVKSKFPHVKLIEISKNLGFAAGNNKARKYCKGEYVLFLNSDTVVYKNTLKKTVNYLEKHKKIGALTCKLVLIDGSLDKDARRSFITPWIGLVHLFLKLDKIFPKSRVFSKYWYGYISADVVHEVDAIQGAFFLSRKSILNEAGWFDEDYYLDGEDIDLCWRIKEKGWKIVYYPKVKVLHLKGASKGKDSIAKKRVPVREKVKFRMSGVNSMEIFYRKRLWSKYPLVVNIAVLMGIKVVKTARLVKLTLVG